MKLYAQHGAMCGNRLEEAAKGGLIDGVIYSPRDITEANLRTSLTIVAKSQPKGDRFFDPQHYACFLAARGDSRLGKLAEEYQQYFRVRTRSELEREQAINGDLARALKFQVGLNITGIIAPNILIPRSFDSIEAVIAKNYIRNARNQYDKLKDKRPLYATLAISRNALTDKSELQEFLNELTVMEQPPDGFYLLIDGSEARSDIFNADTIAAWMLINYSLRVNGFKVINGYSDLLMPFLGATGATAGCTGWFSNLRSFSIGRFGPAGGGRLPVQRYLSIGLLNRIKFTELDALRTRVNGILNKLPSDSIYDADNGSEPPRTQEVFQSWEALKTMNARLTQSNLVENLTECQQAINAARTLYTRIPIPLDVKSNGDHIKELDDGIELFAELAEVKLPT